MLLAATILIDLLLVTSASSSVSQAAVGDESADQRNGMGVDAMTSRVEVETRLAKREWRVGRPKVNWDRDH